MAGNYEAITRMVASEVFRIFKNTTVTPRLLNQNKSKYFSRSGGGAKLGSSIDLPIAIRTVGRDGQAFQPEGLVRQTIPLTINYLVGEDFVYNDTEEALYLRDDIKKNYIVPHAVNLSNKVDRYFMQFMQAATPNFIGTPGVPLTSTNSLDAISSSQTKLNQFLAMESDRAIVWSSVYNQTAVKQGQTLFNPQDIIKNQWLSGKQGTFAKFDIYTDEQTPSGTIGTYAGSPVINGAGQSGATLLINGFTAGSVSLSQNQYTDKFTIAGVTEINKQSRLQYPGVLKQFEFINPVVDTAGAITATIFPAIITSGPYQNVNAAPANGAAVTIAGASGATFNTAFAVQEDAFTWVPIELMNTSPFGSKCEVISDPDIGSIRCIMQWDNRLGEVTVRLDYMFGIAGTEQDSKALLIFG